ncbi:MAG TPA: nucleotidyl transferase AbiEii/AbiGii toxin family protein [Longimicrobium sp.]|nr:nucleotidyl transferase AbiEii/AbiGii toxin family protein [Longimicrobium sp.]
MVIAAPTTEELERAALETGFTVAALERAARMLMLAGELAALSELSGRMMLSGGGALHLCRPDPPRLPADLDFTFLGSAAGAELRADQAAVDDAVRSVLERSGAADGCCWRHEFAVRWLFAFRTAAGGNDTFPVDLIAATPEPLWPATQAVARVPGLEGSVDVWVPDPHEAAGRKLATLFLRRRSRDLFDAHHILTRRTLDEARLRMAFVVGIAARPADSRQFAPEWVGVVEPELRGGLVPYLRGDLRAEAEGDSHWGGRLAGEVKHALGSIFPLRPNEVEFIARLRDRAEIHPELLTDDPDLGGRISRAPELVHHADFARSILSGGCMQL